MTRTDPPRDGSERDTLDGVLDYQRSTVFIKADGLSDADAANVFFHRSRRSRGSCGT